MSFYRSLTFAHTKVPSDQTNIPIGFIGVFSYLATVANGGKVQNASGFDIYFSTDTGGSSVIPFERVHWDPVTGTCEFWINIAALSSTVDTVIYLQYGNSSITTDQSNQTGTWDSNYVGVYHFGDGTTLNVNDSTGSANNGTNHGGTSGNTGITGSGVGSGGASGSLVLNGSSWVDLGTGTSLNLTGDCSFECWGLSGGGGTDRVILARLDVSPNGYFFENNTSGGDGVLNLCNSGTVTNVSGRTVTLTQWTAFIGTYDGTSAKFYTDAALDATATAILALAGSTAHAFIGADPRTTTLFYTGSLDELRISKINRSADWITTQYNNTFGPGSFLTVGSETAGSTPINENISDTFTFSDQVDEFVNLGFAFADAQGGNWADIVTFNLAVPGIVLSDDFSGTWGDLVTLFIIGNLSISDGLSLSDGFSPALTMNAFADTLVLSDSLLDRLDVALQFNDSFTWTDNPIVRAGILVVLADTFTWSDLFQFSSPQNVGVTDFFIWRDQQVVAWSSVLPALTDSFSWSDSVIAANVPFWTPVNETISDTLNLNDSLLYNLAINIGLSDTFSPSDLVATQVVIDPTHQLFQDSFQFGDGVLIIVEGDLLQFADSFTFGDSVLVGNTTSFNSYIRRYLNDEPA